VDWSVVGASVRGVSHSRAGLPCQDRYAFDQVAGTGTLIIAVADGAGSASHSDRGAQVAVQEATSFVRELHKDGEDFTRDAALAVLDASRSKLFASADTLGLHQSQLACTLLVALITDSGAAFVQVGDGGWVINMGGTSFAATWPPTGRYANETSFLTSANWSRAFQFERFLGPIECVAGFTDGLQSVALHHASRTAHNPFFAPLFSTVRESPDPATLGKALEEYLCLPELNRRIDDDRTLVLAVRRRRYLEWTF
jgi:hypothetical protein